MLVSGFSEPWVSVLDNEMLRPSLPKILSHPQVPQHCEASPEPWTNAGSRGIPWAVEARLVHTSRGR